MTNARRLERLTDFMRRLQRRLGLDTQKDMARELGMSRSTYCLRLRNPEDMRLEELLAVIAAARHAGMEEDFWKEVMCP